MADAETEFQLLVSLLTPWRQLLVARGARSTVNERLVTVEQGGSNCLMIKLIERDKLLAKHQ